jgi:hypothetical protein
MKILELLLYVLCGAALWTLLIVASS